MFLRYALRRSEHVARVPFDGDPICRRPSATAAFDRRDSKCLVAMCRLSSPAAARPTLQRYSVVMVDMGMVPYLPSD